VSARWLCFAYAEDRGSAVGAHAFDGWFAVLERDVLWVLDLDVGLTFYAVCLWHSYSSEAAFGPYEYNKLT
jgi:hypothetical protein